MATENDHCISLLDVPKDVLHRILAPLVTEDRIHVFCTCKHMHHFGATDPWCLEQLATLNLNAIDDGMDPLSFSRWLHSRRSHVRRLRLCTSGNVGAGQAFFPILLLGALAGTPLVSLCLCLHAARHLDLGGWVRAFPRLEHLHLNARAITVSRSLARVTSLTTLNLNLYESQRDALDMHQRCLPTSLRHLWLSGIDAVRTAVAQATHLEQLFISSAPHQLMHSTRLGALTNLTALGLRGGLEALPENLSSLQKLQVLDLMCNSLCSSGSAAEESDLLSSLTQLQTLHLDWCIGSTLVHAHNLSLCLPSLKKLSLAADYISSFPHLKYGELEELGLDLDLAVKGRHVFPLMTSLQELRISVYNGRRYGRERLQELPKVLDTLSQLRGLRRVWIVNRKALGSLVGEGQVSSTLRQWRERLGGIEVQLGEDVDEKGFHSKFSTSWRADE